MSLRGSETTVAIQLNICALSIFWIATLRMALLAMTKNAPRLGRATGSVISLFNMLIVVVHKLTGYGFLLRKFIT